MQPQDILTEDQFNKKYWFTPTQLVTVVNPTKKDFNFMVELRPYMVPAGGQERLIGFIANVYLDQLSRIMAQDDDKFQFMVDPMLRAEYYEKLLVDVEDVVKQHEPKPEYLQNHERAQEDQKPFAHLKNKNTTKDPAEDGDKTVPQDKEFVHEGATYQLKVLEDGTEKFYKNGKFCSRETFYKAASMI